MSSIAPFLVPIVGSIGMFAAIITYFYLLYKRREIQSREILAAIEKGIEVPFPKPKVTNYLTQGILWTAFGLALTFALFMTIGAMKHASWGLLPLALGVGMILIHYLQKREKSDS